MNPWHWGLQRFSGLGLTSNDDSGLELGDLVAGMARPNQRDAGESGLGPSPRHLTSPRVHRRWPTIMVVHPLTIRNSA